MRDRRLWAVLTLTVTSLLATAGCSAGADWPMFVGDGDRTPPRRGQELVDHLDDAPIAWKLDHHMGVGKGLYPGPLTLAHEHGIVPFYAGASSPIVADGTVYVTYYKPNGEVPAKVSTWRTMSDPQSLLPDWFFSVTADDILLAVDAKTGKIKWEKVEKNKGLNRLGHKRGHWCVSPAWADGRVFSMGTAGRLYAYDAQSGRKLWEVVAEPGLQKLRKQYLESKQLCWKAGEKSSLVAVEGVVVVPHGGLTAFDAASGREAWKIDEHVLSGHATPAIWRRDGRDYLVANAGRGEVRLIDPRDGVILWTLKGLGQQLGTVTVTGDIAMLNACSEKETNEKNNGLFGAWKLSLDGAKHLWTLPDKPAYRHSWTLDRGAERRTAIQGGKVYLVVGLGRTDKLVVADAETGRILSEHRANGAHAPYPIEDRILLYHDRAHTDPVTAAWWAIDGEPKRLHGEVGFGPRTITGYEVPIQWPYAGGLLYARTLDGMVAFDLRKPPQTPANRTLHMIVPGRITGSRSDLHVTLTQRDGKLTHGGFRRARRLHSVGTSRARWDGRRLTGTLNIDPTGYRQFDDYGIEASLGEGGWLKGIITSRLDAFDEPIELTGKITSIDRQPAWMPPCDYVLQLDDAGIQEGGNRGRLLLFVSVADGELKGVRGFADQTTQARPVVDARGLRLDNGRLTGTVKVRYLADKWAQPLAERGHTAAGAYTIDARLARSGTVGSYKGTYGVAWSLSAKLGQGD